MICIQKLALEIQDLLLSATVLLPRLDDNLELWERICKVSKGIHLQARAGEFGFLTGEEKWNDWKDKKILYVLKSSVSWKEIAEK